MDFLTPEQRSHRMSLIRSKNTKPELEMARLLDSAGIIAEKHAKIFGTPDFVISDLKLAIFVDGEFWHGHGVDLSKMNDWWKNKLKKNMARDRLVNRTLRRSGWSVLRLREKWVKKKPMWCLGTVLFLIKKRKTETILTSSVSAS